MLDLFGDALKVKPKRKRRQYKPVPAFASPSQDGTRYPAVVNGSRVETMCGSVSTSSCVWIVLGPTPRETRAAMFACRRLKRAGYRHVFAEAPKDGKPPESHGAKGQAGATRRRGVPGRRRAAQPVRQDDGAGGTG